MTLKRLWTLNATLRLAQAWVAFEVRRFSPQVAYFVLWLQGDADGTVVAAWLCCALTKPDLECEWASPELRFFSKLTRTLSLGTVMNQTVPDDRARPAVSPRAGAVISGRSLLLRLLVCVVTIVTMSIGGAWLMYAAIDPAADALDGASARYLSVDVDASDRLTAFGTGLRVTTPQPSGSR